MALKVDALRVAQDPKYAASLTDEHWKALSLDHVWNEMVGEHYEMVAPVMALYAQQLGIPPAQDVRRAPPAAPASPDSFDVIRKPVPRLHGYGVVTSQGQYTEHMRM